MTLKEVENFIVLLNEKTGMSCLRLNNFFHNYGLLRFLIIHGRMDLRGIEIKLENEESWIKAKETDLINDLKRITIKGTGETK